MNKNTVLLLLTAALLGGCASVQKFPELDSSHGPIKLEGRGCGVSVAEARAAALEAMSQNIASSIEGRTEFNTAVRNKGGREYFSSEAKRSIVQTTAFKSIGPKFIGYEKETAIFSADKHCVTTLIDDEQLDRYRLHADALRKSIDARLAAFSGRILFSEKAETISGFFNTNYNDIADYNSIVQLLTLFDTGRTRIDYAYAEQRIDARPSVRIDIPTTPKLFSESVTLRAMVDDEDTERLKLLWQFEDKTRIPGRNEITRVFGKPGTFSVTLIAIDAKGNRSEATQPFSFPNNPPISDFSLGKSSYLKGERVTIISRARDPEGQVEKIAYKLRNLATGAAREFASNVAILKVGRYEITETVVDKQGLSSSSTQSLTVESEERRRLFPNMNESQVKSIFGEPIRESSVGIMSMLKLGSKIALEYPDYFILLKGGKLDCVLYKDAYKGGYCDEYSESAISN